MAPTHACSCCARSALLQLRSWASSDSSSSTLHFMLWADRVHGAERLDD